MALVVDQEVMEQNVGTLEPAGPLTIEELDVYRQQLIQMREWLIRGIDNLESRAAAHSQSAKSEGDGNENSLWEQSLAHQAVADKRLQLHEVMQAFERINKNTYGRCIAKNCYIDRQYLSEIPWSRYCPACAARH